MIRVIKSTTYEDGKVHLEIACLSTDTKPTEGIATGSIALVVNTGDVYAYDEAGESWTKIN